MSVYKKILCLVLAAVFVILLTACGNGGNNATVYFELLEAPDNIDPQTAYSDSELIVVRNLFEGLMRVDASGEVKEGACESYSFSGLTYTFNLRKGLKWSNGTKVKAADFVFGLQRALSKETEAPFANRLFAIKNAKAVNNGSTDCSNLGVYSENNKVIIELEYEDSGFLWALSTSVAMPCNEKFFYKTEGKYCQNANSIICNGSYDIFKWNKDDFGIRLYKNKEYSGAYPAKNGAIFFSLDSKQSQTDRLKEKASDIAFVASNELEDAKESGMKIESLENTVWFLTIGNEFNPEIKTALMSTISSDIYSGELGYFRAARSIYPEVLNTSGADGVGMPSYNLSYAKELLRPVIKKSEDEKFPESTLYYYDREEIKGVLTSILGHWQQNLSAFVNMKGSTSLSVMEEELKTHSLQFAVFPVTANSASVSEYLNLLGLTGDTVSAQKALLSNNDTVPLCFETTNIAYNPELTGIKMDKGNGYLDFAYILKDE